MYRLNWKKKDKQKTRASRKIDRKQPKKKNLLQLFIMHALISLFLSKYILYIYTHYSYTQFGRQIIQIVFIIKGTLMFILIPQSLFKCIARTKWGTFIDVPLYLQTPFKVRSKFNNDPALAAEPPLAPAFRFDIFPQRYLQCLRKIQIFIYWRGDDKPVTTSHDL